jgi:hypothetical protein
MRTRLGKGIGLRFFEDANQTKGNSNEEGMSNIVPRIYSVTSVPHFPRRVMEFPNFRKNIAQNIKQTNLADQRG